ncbi:hypothetical protein J3D47_005321 [Pseudomonas laurylsulfativorans]|nr:hypothetical protein [Pseudomonas laurylsulfativorans]
MFGIPHNVVANSREYTTHSMKTDREFQIRTEQIAQSIEQDLAATRLEGPTHPLPPAQAIIRELGVRNTLIARKTADAHQKTLLSHQFFGDTPLNKDFHDYYRKAQSIDRKVSPKGIAMQAWAASYRAAHEANLLTLSIQMLNQQQVEVYKWLATVQANDQEQAAAAAEAQRIAAEQARIRAESEALALAQEQARLAALAEAERVAAEQARIAAEAAARYIAAEQARREAEAEVQRQVEELRLEKQQLAKKESRRNAIESLNIAQGLRPFPVSGAAAASGPVFTVAAGTLAVDAATNLAIRTALRSAAAAAVTALAAVVGTASGAVIVVGVAALAYYALRGKKEPYALSVPLSDLSTYDVNQLHAIANTNGEVELSVAMGSKTTENSTEFVVAAANGTTVPGKVPVRLATYDPDLNVYSIRHPDAPGASMTWTPIIRPGDASTALPVKEPNVVAYNGTTLKALEGRVDTSPALDLYHFGGFIYVFPTESGIAPQYVMFSNPYAGASVNGKYSGRAFNPEEAGGPILDLDWRTATITQAGIDTVKLHIARLNQSDANEIMIQRLEKILSGHRELTDIDLRYYTHEIRELERYRVFGYGDDISPSDHSPIWNNAHTATLEDYKLGSELTLLYTEEAINAMNAQDQREYEKDMRSFGQ